MLGVKTPVIPPLVVAVHGASVGFSKPPLESALGDAEAEADELDAELEEADELDAELEEADELDAELEETDELDAELEEDDAVGVIVLDDELGAPTITIERASTPKTLAGDAVAVPVTSIVIVWESPTTGTPAPVVPVPI